MAVLNRRVVDFDGDIPIEKLMELQNKLKNKEGLSEGKQASFITSKETQLIKEGKFHAQSRPINQYQADKQQIMQPPQPQIQSKPKQESFDMNTFWNPSASKSASNSSNSFDAFSSFFSSSSQPAAKKQNSNTDMYD